MRVFLDTNVLIDFLAERRPFYDDAAIIFNMCRERKINAAVSALSVINCAYILRKAYSKTTMLEKVKWLCNIFQITPINRKSIDDAVAKGGSDFEDTVQYFSSMSHRPDVIISRDKSGFSDFNIAVMTPTEFVSACKK